MVDLHTHTNESDGSYTPAELVQAAKEAGLDALAITDHDTFAGYERALPHAAAMGLDLVRGIELNTRFAVDRGQGSMKTVHLLGYFLEQPPSSQFLLWLSELQAGRLDRNIRLIAKLQSLGVDIELSEVQALGRSLAGRPHFAKILMDKGYAQNRDQAFRQLIGEDAPGFVERDSPSFPVAVQHLLEGGGIPVLAHPIRLGFRNHRDEEAAIAAMRDMGLLGIEVHHSDQNHADRARYQGLADKFGLAASGGSDFHGAAKPSIVLGSGINGNVQTPNELLEGLRRLSLKR